MNERAFEPIDAALWLVLTSLNLGVVGFGLWRFAADARADAVASWLPLVVLGAPMLLMWELRWFTLPTMRRPRPLAAPAGLRVAAVTTFVPAAEPVEMLRGTVRALVALDYPHDTWVLDEGGDPAVEALCRDVGARYFSRRGVERYQAASGRFQRRTKHGNYNAWLDHAGYAAYDVIAIFDPDHVPVRHYLARLLGYLRDPGVAYVQSPQLYYNQAASFIARGAAEETYAYYSSVQMAGYAAGFPVSIGCHTVHRSTALREVGGLPSHDADDLAVTLLYLAAGWRGVYDPCPLAEGLAPVDWQGYLTQQRRWARSVLDLKLRLYPRLVRSLPWRLRLAAGLHGLYYLSGVVFPLLIILICFVLATSHHSTLAHRSAYLPMLALYTCLLTCDLYRQRFFVRRDREFGLHWRAAVLRFAKWPWLLAAFVDVLRPRRTRRLGYQITAKRAQPAPRFLMAPHAVAACAVVAAWVAGRLDGRHPSLVAEIGAAAVLSASLAVLASSVRPFPPPYDPVLAPVAT